MLVFPGTQSKTVNTLSEYGLYKLVTIYISACNFVTSMYLYADTSLNQSLPYDM